MHAGVLEHNEKIRPAVHIVVVRLDIVKNVLDLVVKKFLIYNSVSPTNFRRFTLINKDEQLYRTSKDF